MDPVALKWNNHDSSLINSLDHFKAVDSFVDVTLVCEGHTVKAHKVILAAGSNVLRRLLLANPAKHPILILAETKYDTLRVIIDFLYKGRVDIPRNDLHKVLQVAATFEINDLKNVCEESLNTKKSDSEPNSHPSLKSPVLSGSSVRKKRQWRYSSDSDILIEDTVPKKEINFSPCCFEQSEQTELVEFCPQISGTRSVLISSVEPSTKSNLSGSFIQKVHKDASTECDIFSATSQTEIVEFHPQVSDSRNLLLTSVEPPSESDLTNSSIKQNHKDASTECDNFSVTAETETFESHPQISDSRTVLTTSVESFTRNDLTASSVQKIHKNASTECKAQPLKELMCNNEPKPTRSLPNPKQKVISVQRILPVGEIKRKKRSEIWNFFTPIDETYALCTICKNNFSYRTSVTNLRKHMLTKHPRIRTKTPLFPSADNQIFEEMDIIEDEAGIQVDDSEYEEALDEDVPSTSTPCILKITS